MQVQEIGVHTLTPQIRHRISPARLSTIVSDRDYSKIGQTSLTANPDNSLDVDELHMRETLGLSGRGRPQNRSQPSAAPKQRHRFVQDGEVQVIHLSGAREGDANAASRGRIAALEAALEAEHAARSKAEHAAQASLAQIHALETKLAHVEMATREVVAMERQARELAEADLRLAIAARDAAQQELIAMPPVVVAQPQGKERAKRVPKAKAAPRTREPQPVKWWLGKSAPMAAPRPKTSGDAPSA